MATQATKQQAVVDKEGTGAALNISLHPLVILNISDHFTRQKVLATKNTTPRVIGALFGIQSGRNVELTNSYELIHTEVEGATIIDTEFLTSKQAQYKEVFPNGDLLGWYSTGSECKTSDLKIHQQLVPFNESPLYLLLDTVACSVARELPISIYESELRIVDGEPTNLFSKVSNFRIEPEVAERIAVDHVAHTTTSTGAEGSQLPVQLAGMQNAIKMLNMRLRIIKSYLESVQKGDIPKDHALLRQTIGIINLIPAIDTPKFKEEFLNEYNDALLVSYLASITKGANVMNDLVERYNMAYDKHTRRNRGLGYY